MYTQQLIKLHNQVVKFKIKTPIPFLKVFNSIFEDNYVNDIDYIIMNVNALQIESLQTKTFIKGCLVKIKHGEIKLPKNYKQPICLHCGK